MTTTEAPAEQQPPAEPPAAEPQQETRHHRGWMWLSIGLAVACLGIFAWGAAKSADLSDAQAQSVENTRAVSDAAQDVDATIGAQNEEIAQASSDVAAAQAGTEKAQQDAAAAQAEASSAKSAQARAEAAAKEATAAADEAESKLEVVKGCASAYASAIGTLFDGDSVSEQAQRVKAELAGITEECRAAFGG
jgi:chromosome segregation ATPase